jgi:hypothetical protein
VFPKTQSPATITFRLLRGSYRDVHLQCLRNGIFVNWDFGADWPVDDNPTCRDLACGKGILSNLLRKAQDKKARYSQKKGSSIGKAAAASRGVSYEWLLISFSPEQVQEYRHHGVFRPPVACGAVTEIRFDFVIPSI